MYCYGVKGEGEGGRERGIQIEVTTEMEAEVKVEIKNQAIPESQYNSMLLTVKGSNTAVRATDARAS
jgi:hypothetical protein